MGKCIPCVRLMLPALAIVLVAQGAICLEDTEFVVNIDDEAETNPYEAARISENGGHPNRFVDTSDYSSEVSDAPQFENPVRSEKSLQIYEGDGYDGGKERTYTGEVFEPDIPKETPITADEDFNHFRQKRLYFWEPLGLRFNSFRQKQFRKESNNGTRQNLPDLQGQLSTPGSQLNFLDLPAAEDRLSDDEYQKEIPKLLFLMELKKYVKANQKLKKMLLGSETGPGLFPGDSNLFKGTAADTLKLLKLKQAANALKSKPTKYLSFPLHFYRFMYTPGKKRG